MSRDSWLFLASVLLFLGLGIYYMRPGWMAQLFSRAPGVRSAARTAGGNSGDERVSTQALPVAGGQRERDSTLPWGRNPFLTPEESKTAVAEKLRLNTIIVGPQRAVAVIDGRAVAVGDKINEEKVIAIHPNAVVLEREGRKKVLKIDESALSIAVEERKK